MKSSHFYGNGRLILRRTSLKRKVNKNQDPVHHQVMKGERNLFGGESEILP